MTDKSVRMMSPSLRHYAILSLFATFEFGAAINHPPVIHTACGLLAGYDQRVQFSDMTVSVYAGIPFAAAPIGLLRFHPPVPYPHCPWKGVRYSIPTLSCVHHADGVVGKEDCLFLNVVVPSGSNINSSLPVIVYFHGGNLIHGDAFGELPNCYALASQQNVICITASYRLSVLGWLATPDLAQEQNGSAGNLGTRDALASLAWVKNNIASFGGDPSRVVISGQSSGGTLVFSLMAATFSSNDGSLFTGAISLSGSPNISMQTSEKFSQDASIVETLGCANQSSAELRLRCLRSLSPEAILNAEPGSWGTPGIFGTSLLPPPTQNGMQYAGIVYVDGVLIESSFVNALAYGVNGDVGLIISNMAAEPDGGPGMNVRGMTDTHFRDAMGTMLSEWSDTNNTVNNILTLYANETNIDVQLAYDSLVADYGLTCAGLTIANILTASNARTAPVYLLYNAWSPSKNASDGSSKWPAHGLDWDEIGWSWDFNDPAKSDFEAAALLQQMFGDFARNRGIMPASWNWAPATAVKVTTLVFADNNSSWPGGGVREEVNWHTKQCNGLVALGFNPLYWWCD